MSINYDPPLQNARWVRRNGLPIGLIWSTPYGFQYANFTDLPVSYGYQTLIELERDLEDD